MSPLDARHSQQQTLEVVEERYSGKMTNSNYEGINFSVQYLAKKPGEGRENCVIEGAILHVCPYDQEPAC
jgi:hypothetical protein